MKPTANQLSGALKRAQEMRAQGEDPDYLAQSVIYLQRRDAMLERILLHLERYLQFGHPEEEHSKLIRLVDDAREIERIEKGAGKGDFGL